MCKRKGKFKGIYGGRSVFKLIAGGTVVAETGKGVTLTRDSEEPTTL